MQFWSRLLERFGESGTRSFPPPAPLSMRNRLSLTAVGDVHAAPTGHAHTALALAALGVVFGDIGTSPLYAIKECFHGTHGVAPTPANVLGVLSLMAWSLTAVVTFKYLAFITRADNEGEGGMLALLALVPRKEATGTFSKPLVLLALFGTALLYGEGVMTPAISVLSAVEGLTIGAPALERLVLPSTVCILIGLFAVQKRGTASVGRFFGPIMLVWFVVIAALGINQIVRYPDVLRALNPYYAAAFMVNGGYQSFLVLGAVVLCITGGEALYADMGHFGRLPIRTAWLTFAMPALLINYFGQGALLLTTPSAVDSPFFSLAPRSALYPLIALATVAAVIASQALISGAYSLTQQAVQLGYCPRVTVVHTSETQEGQIYVPEVNWALAIACIVLVLEFKSSVNLAAAYGIAVTGTMSITSIMFFVVVTKRWGWPVWKALPLVLFFLSFDLSFFSANMVKVADGGWVPLALGTLIFTVMTTWKTGRSMLAAEVAKLTTTLEAFQREIRAENPPRVRGTAVFMSANPQGIPPVLRHHYEHNQVLHDQVVLLSIRTKDVPFVVPASRIEMRSLGDGLYQVFGSYGFMETPNVPSVLQACAAHGLVVDPGTVTFYLGRETLIASARRGMSRWRKRLFAFVSLNARPPTAYFGIPPGRVVELGVQIEL